MRVNNRHAGTSVSNGDKIATQEGPFLIALSQQRSKHRRPAFFSNIVALSPRSYFALT